MDGFGDSILSKTGKMIDRLQAVTPNVTNPLQDWLETALENIKVYQPEIIRLDGRVDSVNKDVQDLSQATRKELDEHVAGSEIVSRRCTALEERVAQLEAFIAALPTWKEDLLSKVETQGRDARVKHEQLSVRTQNLEDLQAQHAQATRERLDGLTMLARSQGEARAAHAERMDKLEHRIKEVDTESKDTARRLTDAVEAHAKELQTHGRKLVDQSAAISLSRSDIGTLKQRASELEQDASASRSDILVLQDKHELVYQSIMLMDKQIKTNETLRDGLAERLLVIERDTRIQGLQVTANDYVGFKKEVSSFMTGNTRDMTDVAKKITDMDQRIDKGHPGLWKITETVAAQSEEIATHHGELDKARTQLSRLEQNVEHAKKLIADQKEVASVLQNDGSDMKERLNTEVKRCMTYIDSRLEPLSAKYELEALRQLIESVRSELHDAISGMSQKVKFELLHDEVPQVNTLKAYIQQTEQAMARTLERLAVLECGLANEKRRGDVTRDDWTTTKRILDTMILDGTFDVAGMRRELQTFKDLFQELGKLAARGQIITVSQTEDLVTRMLNGPVVEAAVTRKLVDSKVLQQELAGYVPRHELEGLRRVLANSTALAHMATTIANGESLSDTQLLSTGATNSTTGAPQQQMTETSGAKNTNNSSRPGSGMSRSGNPRNRSARSPANIANGTASGMSTPLPQPQATPGNSNSQLQRTLQSGPPVTPPVQQLYPEDSALLTVYTRLAAIDEAIATTTAQASSLQDKLSETSQRLAAIISQVDADVPTLKRQLRDLQDQIEDKGPASNTPAMQSAVRAALNKTILPEVIERHASDMQHLTQYVDARLSRSATQTQIKQLQDTISQLQQQLRKATKQREDTGSDELHGSDQQGDVDSSSSSAPGGDQLGTAPMQASPPLQSEAQKAVPEDPADSVSIKPDLNELSASIQVLTARLGALERSINVNQETTATVSSKIGQTMKRLDLAIVEDMSLQLSELQAKVHDISAQLPMLAKSYEVQGLQQILEDMQQEFDIKLAQAPGATQLHVTIACPHTNTRRSTSQNLISQLMGSQPQVKLSTEQVVMQSLTSAPSSRPVSRSQVSFSGGVVADVDQPRNASQLQSPTDGKAAPTQSPAMVDTVPTVSSADQLQGQSSLRSESNEIAADDIAGIHPTESATSEITTHQEPSGTSQSPHAHESDESCNVDIALPVETATTESDTVQTPAADSAVPISQEENNDVGDDNDHASAAQQALQLQQECYALLQQHCAWQQVMSGQMARQMAACQLQCTLAQERAAALEQRWLAAASRWNQSFELVQDALPKIERLAATTQSNVDKVQSQVSRLVSQSELEELLQASHLLHDMQDEINTLKSATDTLSLGPARSAMSSPSLMKPMSPAQKRALLAARSAGVAQSSLASPNSLSAMGSSLSLAEVLSPKPGGVSRALSRQTTIASDAGATQEDGGVADEKNLLSEQYDDVSRTNNSKPSQPVDSSNVTQPQAPPSTYQQQQQQLMDVSSVDAAAAGLPGFQQGGVARHIVRAEHADTELAGIMHDLMHSSYLGLLAVKDGPLPGSAAIDAGQGNSIREAALRRLHAKPFAVQKHVELLETVKNQLDRLVSSTAVSTVDYLSLFCVMIDIRLKLAEDHIDRHSEQLSTAYRNLESAFNYMKKLQEAVNTKGSLAGLQAVDRCLRSLGKEMIDLGHPPPAGGHPGILFGTTIGSGEFWAPFLTIGADRGADTVGSPVRTSAGKLRRSTVPDRPVSAVSGRSSSSYYQVIPHVMGNAMSLAGSPFPPPSFLRDKRDVLNEQQKVMNVLKAAEQQLESAAQGTQAARMSGSISHLQAGLQTSEVKYITADATKTSGLGLPVLVKTRPSTAVRRD